MDPFASYIKNVALYITVLEHVEDLLELVKRERTGECGAAGYCEVRLLQG